MAKSFSIKIGADTKEFINGLKAADKSINSTRKLGEQLNKSLQVEYNETVAVEAQKQLQKALTATEDKAQKIRDQLKILEQSGRIDTIDYQTLQTELAKAEMEAVKLKDSLEQAKNIKFEELSKKVNDVGSGIENAGKKLSVFSAAAAGAIVGAVKLAKDAVKAGDELAKASDMYGLSAEAIQHWQYVALQTNTSAEELLKGAAKIRAGFGAQTIGEINNVTKVLDELGINIANFSGSEEAFEATILALSRIEDSTLQALYAQKLFGEDAAAKMLPLLTQGAEAINKYSAEFEQVGYLSNETVAKLSELDNEVNKVTAQFEHAKTELGIAMIPIYQSLVKILEEHVIPAVRSLSNWFGNLAPNTQNLILGLLGMTAALAPILILVGKVYSGVGALIPMMSKLNNITNLTAKQFAILGGALVLGLNLISDWKNMSAVEKILKTLALAALAAAAAVTIFHASWSLGAAVGVIAAGVVAGIAAIKAAAAEVDIDAEINADGTVSGATPSSGGLSGQDMSDIDNYISSANERAGSSNIYQNTENISNDTYYITIEANEYTNPQELVDAVSKQIATLSKARG